MMPHCGSPRAWCIVNTRLPRGDSRGVSQRTHPLGRDHRAAGEPAGLTVMATTVHLASQPPRPPHRALRGYAFDPSLATSLETALVSQITYRIPWEDLSPGPIGEYLEVVDFDPASGCFYAPVDLNNPNVLAQNG